MFRLNRWHLGGLVGLAAAGAVLVFVSWNPLHTYGGPQFEPTSLYAAIGLAIAGSAMLILGFVRPRR